MMDEKFNYYKVQASWGEEIQYITDTIAKRYNDEYGWTCEKLQTKRYNDEIFKKIVKKVLKENGTLGTTDLWKKCKLNGLLLQRKTFLKRLRQIDDDWLLLDVIGSSYVWSLKE